MLLAGRRSWRSDRPRGGPRRTVVASASRSAAIIGLAALVARTRVAAYDPFADPSCANCGHATPLLQPHLDQRGGSTARRPSSRSPRPAGSPGLRCASCVAARASRTKAGPPWSAASSWVSRCWSASRPGRPRCRRGARASRAAARIGAVLVAVGLIWFAADLVRVRVAMRRLAQDLTSAIGAGQARCPPGPRALRPDPRGRLPGPNDGRYVAADGTTLGSAGYGRPARPRHDRARRTPDRRRSRTAATSSRPPSGTS